MDFKGEGLQGKTLTNRCQRFPLSNFWTIQYQKNEDLIELYLLKCTQEMAICIVATQDKL